MDKNKLKISTKSLRNISDNTKEAEWYHLLRKKAMYENYSLNFPKLESMNLEEWSLLDFNINNFFNETENNFNKDDYAEEIDFNDESIIIIQKNNKLAYLNIPEVYKNKILVQNIFEAINDNKNFKNIFAQITRPNKDKLTSLHYLLLNSGIYVEVFANEIDIPLQYYVITENDYSLFNHVTINIKNNSNLNFVENYISKNNKKAFNIISEVLVGENSNINYTSITNFEENARGTILRNGETGRNATLNWNVAAMDSADVYQDNTTNILGDGAESNLKIVTLGSGNQKLYFNSELVNQGLNTNGDILQHGVLLDSSHVVFNGIGFIVKGATGSNAYQSSRLLSLSENAKSDANPMLLIDENDVAAGHGASLGKIDEEQIYYLKSRGLSEKEASRLLVHGFLSPVIEQLSLEKVKNKTTQLIDKKITKRVSK
ncbi:Fe-S cluster assembly protein SufD [Gemella sp. zg-1178]|uniref:Fe-S cluster assembly protein SufD n=1 Tax=Gemella sp. zg-1178 TaxID=2840372 RepID=UPI001C04FDA7|nr:Fe-S cluster assembly protein SufD [Gemella sp. zg-1178]MBU0278518.1 Fe-S cluster assembly protein SufD [Gemella sp. zg-1178]